ncbi:MAG: hypothetical protein HZA20_13415 [Nitrospirae bacterium]|nr:hypothetical protein [Nitrospirota bacterium]
MDNISDAFSTPERITNALAAGVRDALLKHKQTGNPIVVWQNGEIVWIKAEDIPLVFPETLTST